ncbi:MAG TPA: hypothetical protein VJV79_05720 [Polyangiaceae bacterium]|nr:hypothetical protein [Polyangiaceae bacterium]
MKQTSRRVWVGLLLAGSFGVVGLSGCSGAGGDEGDSKALGQIGLPLTTQGASGVTYRLRNATFVVQGQSYSYVDAAGAGGTSGNPGTVIVSSETNPNASNISLSLEEGYYNVRLLPGWSMEKATSAGAQPVEATLLSAASQWLYVSRQSTSWAEYSFGIGGREIWLNGKLNITIGVQETPQGAGGEGPGVGGEAGSAGSGFEDSYGGAADFPE